MLNSELNKAKTNSWLTGLAKFPELSATPLVLLIPLGQPGPFAELKGSSIAGFVNNPIVPSELFNVLISLGQKDVAATPTQGAVAAPTERRTIPKTRHETAKILLAEDNPINQNVATHILKCFGYSFDVVSNGREAIRAWPRNYDLVLMDCQMPEMDGYEATRAVRRWEEDGRPRGGKLACRSSL